MHASPQALAERVDAFAFDAPGVLDTFSKRLARENDWSEEHAARVIREYRRFLVLAASADHAVSPSDPVDQAWHLHLLDTAGYRRFCRDVLGRRLDHRPSHGGAAERRRLFGDYQQTLLSYRKQFGEPPPADIWPNADQRFAAEPRARLVTLPGLILVAGALSLALAGCAAELEAPGTLTGPEFLGLHLVIWLSSLLVAWVVKKRKLASREVTLPELHPYEVAQLSGGPELALDSALTSLIARGSLVCDHETAVLRVTGNRFEPEHPLEQELHAWALSQTDGLSLRWDPLESTCRHASLSIL